MGFLLVILFWLMVVGSLWTIIGLLIGVLATLRRRLPLPAPPPPPKFKR